MASKVKILFFFAVLLLVAVLSSVSADFAGCWSASNTTNAICAAGNNCVWSTPASDPWCDSTWNPNGCCMEKGCWQYGTDNSTCSTNDGTLSCNWDPSMTMWYPNGTQSAPGGCMEDWTNSNQTWGGFTEGCWQYDGNKASCGAQGSGCKWTANDQNQDPWCPIKSLSEAQKKNSGATSLDIGCCQTSGCWNYDSNETSCTASSTFQGSCYYTNNTYGGGWCSPKPASELNEVQCNLSKQTLFMPYNWNGTSCVDGGFTSFTDSDSCFSAGGWYNSTGDCVMPTSGVGDTGAFMFSEGAHCWFADNQPNVCGNVTGCAYCVAGSGDFGVDNNSVSNICSRKQAGFCEGHNTGEGDIYGNANNSANLVCTNIQVKSACNYGPLQNCKWTNSSSTIGAYCQAGSSSEKKSAPPAQFCEDAVAKNNYTICMQLAKDFMMPCKWQNTTYPYTNCTFNGNAVFGGSGGEIDFGVINSQFSCTSAGGTWQTEYYVDGDILKQDSWCEMTGFFDINQGKGQGNKGNCDTSCWACEFQNNGTAWANVGAAQNACTTSALGNCQWTNDTYSFNKIGHCDFPKEMENGGAKDCNTDCASCGFMNDAQNACEGSQASNGVGCKWVNDTNNAAKGGFCVDKTKKTCESDCFSCLDFTSCTDSSTPLDCNWDQTFNLCSPNGFTGEVCFNGVDDDGNGLIDCSDPSCSFDNFCGGSSFGGSCFAQTSNATCSNTAAFGNLNCTWINDTWNPTGWCDMPGANCWKFDSDLATCGNTPGCTNTSVSMGTSAWCQMNQTKMDNAACWGASTEAACSALPGDCSWKNNTWGGASAGSGWCDYAIMSTCSSLNTTSACNTNPSCSWRADNYSFAGGWCDIICMNQDLSQPSCENATLNGLCQWKNMSATCQPETFMMMGSPGGGAGGKMGCAQYDGNQTACVGNNITCTYKNDTYANNGVAPANNPGWCMGKSEFEHFGEMEGNIIDLAMDGDNPEGQGGPGIEVGVDSQVDLMGMGMRVTDTGFDFGAGVYNISNAVMCNGFMIGNKMNPFAQKTLGNGNKTTKFYWYLDTDGSNTGGCAAIPQSGSNLTGFDFMVSYSSRNTSSGTVETKQLMRCASGTWSPTNALVTTSKKLSCGEIGGVMIAISKQDLESFSEYNKTANLRIFMSSANETKSRTSPSDSVGPGYYTKGSIDFGFVDCSNPSNAQNPKCKNFQKFGFNVFEECKNQIDDDENGLIDCADPFCSFMPDCNNGNGFNFSVDSNDKTAPTISFSKFEKLSDSAFGRFDTSEPSNLTLEFYKNDSTCASANLNITVNDIGSSGVGNEYQSNANFKPFHSVDLMQDTIGYNLQNGTPYYYKIKVCDPSSNCAISACSNFTTKTSSVDKSFIFKMNLPDGYTVDIPALNKTGYNFTENFGETFYDVGIKTNTSITKNMNMTIHCGNLSLGFYGMNVLNPTKIDLSNAFVCDTSIGYIGMNSTLKKWNKLIEDLHLGGASDYVEVGLPIAYDANNVLNWTSDDGTSNGQDVNDYVVCSGNSTSTACKVPVSMGFSAYQISVPAASSEDSGGSSGGGGGGGGAASGATYVLSEAQFLEGYSNQLAINDKIKFNVKNESHEVKFIELTESTAKINVSSETQQATLSIGDERNFELSGDNFYDLKVILDSIDFTSKKVNFTIISIDEEVTPETIAEENSKEGNAKVAEESANETSDVGSGISFGNLENFDLFRIIGVILILGLIFWVLKKHKK